MLTSVDQSLSNSTYRDLGIEAQLIKPARSSALLETLVHTIQKRRHATGGNASQAGVPASATETDPTPALTAPPAAVATRTSLSDGHRLDILVAEDNEVNQLVFTQILADTPYSFEIVGNGRRAVETFTARNPRMILMDVSMPEMNGIEATAAIRSLEADGSSHVPIVGVTAHALKGDRERCLDAGMDDYLPKPISPKALLEKLDRWTRFESAGQRSAG
jgi:CheY-like chemotaxis protein